MNHSIKNRILQATNAKSINRIELIQNLWNNYGHLSRIYLNSDQTPSVILKHIKIPINQNHPKGFNTEFSKQRKIKSYEVEINWYEKYNKKNLQDSKSPTPKCLSSFQVDGEYFMLLEDLDSLGYTERLSQINFEEIKVILSWLAAFHGKFLQKHFNNLWETGTYWHLETRPHELEKIEEPILRMVAPLIDSKLRNCTYFTVIHGDAKLANFCFSKNHDKVAGVDFQYVGRGCGMKDLAYFIGSCLEELECEKLESEILDFYFHELKNNIHDPNIDKQKLEDEWRELYHVAWADFHRFLKGWSPEHWKIHSYSERVTTQVTETLLHNLCEIAQKAAFDAGQIIKSYWKKDFEINSKQGSTPSNSVVTEVDLLAQENIVSKLKQSMDQYDIGLLTEESSDNHSRFEKPFFWCIDPLDGTLPFSEGKSGFAVSIALINKSGIPIIGVVYDPIEDNLFHAIYKTGYWVNNKSISKKQSPQQKVKLFVDRSFKDHPQFSNLQNEFDISFPGGAVINSINTLQHENSCYLKFPKNSLGGCAIWDLAGIAVIMQESGSWISDFNGKPLNFNQESVYFNQQGLMICDSEPTMIEVKDILGKYQ